MIANWQLAPERANQLPREYQRVFDEVGPDRFDRGVTAIVDANPYISFPTVAEFRGYIPLRDAAPYCDRCQQGWVKVPDWDARRLYGHPSAMAVVRCECRGMENEIRRAAEYQELYRRRSAEPAEYFGTADVVCMMRLFQSRAAKGKTPPDEDAVFATIAKVRERAGFAQ